jgi:hypothetical protein
MFVALPNQVWVEKSTDAPLSRPIAAPIVRDRNLVQSMHRVAGAMTAIQISPSASRMSRRAIELRRQTSLPPIRLSSRFHSMMIGPAVQIPRAMQGSPEMKMASPPTGPIAAHREIRSPSGVAAMVVGLRS